MCEHCFILQAQLDQAHEELRQYQAMYGQLVRFVVEAEAQTALFLSRVIRARESLWSSDGSHDA